MSDSRKKKSLINIMSSVGYQVFTIIMNFVSRTVFINVLGTGVLGLSSLFTNILSILSLAELGVGSAMMYSLYRPLAEKDEKKLAALVQYFRKVYFSIAGVILVIGLGLIPFLSDIIHLEKPIDHITIYYLLYLIDTVVSYLCMYKTAILNADQKAYKLNIYRGVFDTVRIILQIILMLLFQNFALYILIQITVSVFNNIYSAHAANKQYPYITKNVSEISDTEKKSLWANVMSIFSYKLGGVILNNTDQLLISMLVSTEVVGLYSNYYLPVKSVSAITSSIFLGILASVGNLAVEGNVKKQYQIFKVLDFVSFWIYGFCSICFSVLLQDFISLWLGKEYLLSQNMVYIMALNFYCLGILYPTACYRETAGLFKHTKNILFYTATINIILSVVLGKIFGIEGILFATILARVLTNMWFEPYKLFKVFFDKKVLRYYLKKIIELVMLIFCVALINWISQINGGYPVWIRFIFKCALCCVIPNALIICVSYRTDEFKYVMDSINGFFHIKRKKE